MLRVLIVVLSLFMTSQNIANSIWCPKGDLSFEDMKVLSTAEYPNQCAAQKLEATLFRPIYKQAIPYPAPKLQFDKTLQKHFVRVAHWNIERGFNVDQIKKILSDPEKYLKEDLDTKEYPYKSEKYAELLSEIRNIKDADIILLNEVDIGIGRTDYRNIVEELAKATDMGYAYATEFVEVDPELLHSVSKQDQGRYRGLHGNAILTKFPIKNMRVIRLPVFYDWFHKEQERVSLLEETKRAAAKATIKEEIFTEVRRGSRVALMAELTLPNNDVLTVVSTHLEDRTSAKNREKQMSHLLYSIKDIKGPVVLGGDLNSFEFDASPTSLTKIAKDKATDANFMGKLALNLVNPFALATNVASTTVGQTRKFKDPTVSSVPVLLPNKARGLFKLIEKFRFNDGKSFNFSGKEELSYDGKKGELSNSNQRGKKGYIETLKLERSFKVGRYKIDWLFVKSVGSRNKPRYLPAFGRTLKKLNYSYKDHRISDHSPITVDVLI